MFVAVRQDVAGREIRRAHSGLKRIFMRRDLYTLEYRGDGKARFALVTLRDERGWRELRRICGLGAARIVSASPIDGRYAARFEPAVFLRVLLFNTALRLLESLECPERWLDIDIVDIHGVCAGFIEPVVRRCRRVRVVTCRAERYRALTRRLLCEYGAALTVSPPDAKPGGALCLLGDGEAAADGTVLRCHGEPKTPSELLILEPETPEWAREIIPPEFSPRELLGAMYEINREERCGELCAALLLDCRGNVLSRSEACEKITALLKSRRQAS